MHSTTGSQQSASAFSNAVVAIADLPDFRDAPMQPVSPRFTPYAIFSAAWFWLLLMVAMVFVPQLPRLDFDLPGWLPALPGVALLWFCMVAGLDARRRRWAVREHDLIYRSGLIWQRTVIVPFSRIQHVETASGPVERAMGLMRVKCFTAGGLTADVVVEGLERELARQVRQHLLAQIRDDEPRAAADPGLEE